LKRRNQDQKKKFSLKYGPKKNWRTCRGKGHGERRERGKLNRDPSEGKTIGKKKEKKGAKGVGGPDLISIGEGQTGREM